MRAFILLIAAALLSAPATGLALDTDEVTDLVADASDPTRYAVGMDAVPRGMEVGDRYNGGEVVLVNKVLHFIAVETENPALFEAQTRTDDNVRYLELDPERQMITFDPNDQYEDCCQYATTQVNLETAWDTTLGDWDANVCVVDTGIRYTHEDLQANYRGGTDTYNGDSDPWDDNGHGTHVSGTVAAGLNNALGVAGMGNVGLYHAKALSGSGSGSFSAIASAIQWCADNTPGNVVISMSLGGSSGTTTLQNAVEYAHGTGALLVGAAGNDGPCSNCVGYPAAYPEVVAVTCTKEGETQCSFSSDGPEAELAAPGERIASTYNRNNADYVYLDGTSMSTPHVSGIAALVWSEATTISRDQLRTILQDTAQDLGASGWDQLYGYGEVDAADALDAALSGGGDGGGGTTTVYAEDWDNYGGGWSKSSMSNDLWRLASDCVTPTSGTTSLAFSRASPNCDYDAGTAEGWANSPGIDNSAGTSSTLSFNHWWETESYSGGAYDIMRVQVSSNGGSSWTTLDQWDSRDANPSGWQAASYDVTSYMSSTFEVRFTFDTVDNSFNDFPGWYIDDIEVTVS